jgi:hypothetical protein
MSDYLDHRTSRRPLSRKEARMVARAFCARHMQCAEDLEIHEGAQTLVCVCRRCGDVRSYRLSGDS